MICNEGLFAASTLADISSQPTTSAVIEEGAVNEHEAGVPSASTPFDVQQQSIPVEEECSVATKVRAERNERTLIGSVVSDVGLFVTSTLVDISGQPTFFGCNRSGG